MLNALAILFESGKTVIAIACVIDHYKRSVNLIIVANRDILNQKI